MTGHGGVGMLRSLQLAKESGPYAKYIEVLMDKIYTTLN